MKKAILMVLVVALSATGLNAQTSDSKSKVWDRLIFNPQLSAGFKQHDVQPMIIGANIGYEFVPRFYAFIRAEGVYGLYENDGTRTWAKSNNLGGGLGFRLLGGKEAKGTGNFKDGLDLRLMAGTSVGHASWKQTFYDAGLQYYLRGSRFAISPTLGLGYRFTDSRTNAMRDMHTVYVSLGFRF